LNPKELILAARLTEARNELVAMVKKTPADCGARSLLIQVLILFGEWDKALRHIEILTSYSPTSEMGTSVYENLFKAEKERLQVADLEIRPTFVPESPVYFDDHWQAMALLADNQTEAAARIAAQVAGGRPAIGGTINGLPFKGFEDTDARLFCFIEAIEYERYLWIPIECIRELVVSPPKTLMDMIWAKGRITTWKGLTMGCFFPVNYPRSFAVDDDRIRLGRMTDWQSLGSGLSKAVGQHVFHVGDEDVGILEIGEVLFTHPDAELKGEFHA